MGVDPIKDYEEKQADTILGKVAPGDRKCKVCDKSCSSTQKLKNHIRRRHIGKTPYQCGVCQHYYGDSQSLKVHLKKYAKPGEEVKMFNCEHEGCSASYPTLGKFNEHKQKHEDIRCSFCNKTFAYNRTKTAHEQESCARKPGASKSSKKGDKSKEDVDEEEASSSKWWYCHKCNADYGARRNLKKHLNTHHGGAEVA